jgi:hypothetical protein
LSILSSEELQEGAWAAATGKILLSKPYNREFAKCVRANNNLTVSKNKACN